MCETLGVDGWCKMCQGSEEKDGELICQDSEGVFYGLPVDNVLCTPCRKRIKVSTERKTKQ